MLPPLALIAATLFVSPNGSDANPGTRARPLQSLAAAVERARSTQSHTINLLGGTYRLNKGLELDSRDNGFVIAGIGPTRARLSGALSIPTTAVRECQDGAVLRRIIDPAARTKVKVVDLGALGQRDLAALGPYGWGHNFLPAPNELLIDDQPMTLARWPNTGFTHVGQIIEPGNGEKDRDQPKRQPVFYGAEDRAKLWSQAQDIALYGYWKFDWADESIRVSGVGTDGKLTLAGPHVYGIEKGKPFFAENLLEELDQPGEYFVDRATAKLYFIPPAHPYKSLELTSLGDTFLSISGASKVTLRGLDFSGGRHEAVKVSNGEGVSLQACRFFNLGGLGVRIEGGHDNAVQSCDIWNTGEGGVVLSGGDRRGLSTGRNAVDNCDISNYQRRAKTYRPAVLVSGVGNRVSHSAMHDAPHSAIIYGGNDHVFEYNEFYKTVQVTGDGGVVYCGRDWSARGTRIQFNHFHDNIGLRQWEPAIYVDDCGSGIISYGNLIERCHWGFMIGGGRDNVVEKNVLVDCKLAFHCDARGLGWMANGFPTMKTNLEAVPYQSPVWAAKYPALVDILKNTPMAPDANVIRDNILVRSGQVEADMEAPFKKTVKLGGNQVLEKLPANANNLPVKEMGLKQDALRKSLPKRS